MKKKKVEVQRADLHQAVIIIVQSVAQTLGIPPFFVNIAIDQIRSMDREQLKKILKIIWKQLKPMAGELDD